MKRHKFIKATAQDVKTEDIIRYKENGTTWIVKIASMEKVDNGIKYFGTLLPKWTRVQDDNGDWTKELFEGRDNFEGFVRLNKKLEIAID